MIDGADSRGRLFLMRATVVRALLFFVLVCVDVLDEERACVTGEGGYGKQGQMMRNRWD